MATILCVDDEPSVGVVLERALLRLGHRALIASSAEDAQGIITRTPVDLVIADFKMPRMTGLDLLRWIQDEGYRMPVIIITGHSSIEHAVDSIKAGAFDYLTKPVHPETLEVAVSHALELTRLRRENESYQAELQRVRTRRAIVGQSAAITRVLDMVATVATTRAAVLIEGESGTGKELIARAIHDHSPRRQASFIAINCAALPEGLVESVLFGHEKGAFTGATARTPGAFERAEGGTLLLDEISEMQPDLQAKLLRVIQEQEFERVGGSRTMPADVRIIATTNRDLRAAVDAGTFRSDLYYRLYVVPITMPPLRERAGDIPLLAQHFMKLVAEELNVGVPALAPEAVEVLRDYTWPGNVRELAHTIERAMILTRGKTLTAEHVRVHLAAAADRPATAAADTTPAAVNDLPINLKALQAIAIQRALAETGGNRTRAARLLGISERTLRNKLNNPNRESRAS